MEVKDIGEILKALGVGLNQMLRYFYGGVLLLFLGSVVNSDKTGKIVDAIHPTLAVVVALVVGAGLYATHRSLVIPFHHLFGCFLFWAWETWRLKRGSSDQARWKLWKYKCAKVPKEQSRSPTRWLGSTEITVRPCLRMWAYSTLRRRDLWTEDEKRKLDVAHAENGLVVMTFEGFLVAGVFAVFAYFWPEMLVNNAGIKAAVFFVLSGVFLLASYPMAWEQHTLECLYMRTKVDDVRRILESTGILRRQDGVATGGTGSTGTPAPSPTTTPGAGSE